MASFFPAIGSWYQETATSLLFEVVAIDEKYGTIEVQYQDGDIAEFETESWGLLDIIPSATIPKEGDVSFCDAPFENEYADTLDINPIQNFEPESFNGFDDLF